MKSYALIHELISLVEKLEADSEGKEITLNSFTGYLISHIENGAVTKGTSPDVRFGEHATDAQEMAYRLDNSIGRLVIYMSRYAKAYIRKALGKTPLKSPEDFTCLAILLTHESLLKGELIERNLQEKTSGTEVIRRLMNAGLVSQWDDEQDKRSKRLAISPKGKELLYGVFEDMNSVGKVVCGDLSLHEKSTLLYLLQKLEYFHHSLHEKKAIKNKNDLSALAAKL